MIILCWFWFGLDFSDGLKRFYRRNVEKFLINDTRSYLYQHVMRKSKME